MDTFNNIHISGISKRFPDNGTSKKPQSESVLAATTSKEYDIFPEGHPVARLSNLPRSQILPKKEDPREPSK